MNLQRHIHLGITFDQNYLTLFYVLLTSVFANNKKNKITIHAIATGVDAEEREKIKIFIQAHGGDIFFYDFDGAQASQLTLTQGKHLTAATYYRLYLPALVPGHIQKLLYLDTDIVVIGDLWDLYNTDLKGLPAAAVNYPDSQPRPELNLHTPGNYFNAGVMLINQSVWKEGAISQKTIQFAQQNPEKCRLNDQDALNAVLVNNYYKLELKYNVTLSDIPDDLGKSKYKTFLSDKVIIHYTRGGHKPWKMLGKNKFRHLYHYYLKQSPRKEERKYSDFKFSPTKLMFFLKIRTEERMMDYPVAYKVFKKINKRKARSGKL